MRVTCLSENIIPFLSLLLRTISIRTQVPVLQNILLEAKREGLFISATDLEFGIRIKIPAKIEIEGETTVPGKQFVEVLQALSGNKVLFESEKEAFLIRVNEDRMAFQTIPAEEFPRVSVEEKSDKIEFSSQDFHSIFSPIIFSVSSDGSRPQIGGVFCRVFAKGSEFVATDGFRLSLKKTNKKIFDDEREGIIIGDRILNEILSMKDVKKEISMYIPKEGNQVIFESGEVVMVGRLIQGDFPPYQKVIPSDFKTKATVSSEEFMQAVKLSSVFARDNANIVRLIFAKSSIKFSSRSQGVGEGELVVGANVTGDENEISFNVKFLSDFLKNIEGKSVSIEVKSGVEPALFKVDSDDSFIHIIMPVRVQE